MIALAFTLLLLIVIGGITLTVSTKDRSLLQKTEQDSQKYNEQAGKYENEYIGLTQKVDEPKNRIDSMPEDF